MVRTARREGPRPQALLGVRSAFRELPGCRTKFFDTYFYAAADAGVRQIVIPAAGLDSRAYRLAWPNATVVFELDQPEVLEFKRQVLARHGDAPTAERREIAVDLRDDWPQALLEQGFDASAPSAWLAEGLLIYLPATAQRQLFTGIDALAASGSHVAVEEATPMGESDLKTARAEERASGNEGQFFSLIYNEQHAPAVDWFGNHGWRAEAVRLTDYFHRVGRPVPGPDSEAAPMFADISLVSAIKA